MPMVTLAKAVRLPGHPMRPAGTRMDVPQDVVDKFSPMGVFADDSEEQSPKKVEPVVKPVEAVEGKPVRKKSARGERPRRSASIDEWRKFAEGMGINPKGLSKQELIASTR